MKGILRTRLQQGYHTIRYPDGAPPELPLRFSGRPVLDDSRCASGCRACVEVCPTQAIQVKGEPSRLQLDLGRCIFCLACQAACPAQSIAFGREFRLAAARREDLMVEAARSGLPAAVQSQAKKLFGRSLRLRQVSAGGCNACEADVNVLTTLAWDLGRFGIGFVAAPRHADGLLITGPVPENMRSALLKTYAAVPAPKLVIAVGACAIAGGPYADHPEAHNGADGLLPVDLYIPGCPPHPLTILEGLLALLGRVDRPPSRASA